MAVELLGDPRLILLDEATSGLDPGTDAEMMELFRSLADEGRTIICVTHSPSKLHLCDRLVCLREGICTFQGKPADATAFFGVTKIEDIYSRLASGTAGEWRKRFETAFPGRSGRLTPAARTAPAPTPSTPRVSFGEQTALLSGRYARLQFADWQALGLQLIQPPIIGAMIAFSFGSIRSSFAEQAAADTKLVLFVMTLAVMWCSGTSSAREVVKELPILRHESRFGLRTAAYLASKLIWLGGLAVVQSAVLLLIVRRTTELAGPFDLQVALLAITSIVGVALGLCISSLAGSSERAMTILPVALIGLAVFSGGLARLVGPPLWVAWIGSPAYWTLDGLKSPLPSSFKNATYPGAPGTFQPPILGSGGPLALDVLALLLQGAVLLAVGYASLRYALGRSDR